MAERLLESMTVRQLLGYLDDVYGEMTQLYMQVEIVDPKTKQRIQTKIRDMRIEIDHVHDAIVQKCRG